MVGTICIRAKTLEKHGIPAKKGVTTEILIPLFTNHEINERARPKTPCFEAA
jgi:hypothetical protein